MAVSDELSPTALELCKKLELREYSTFNFIRIIT